MTPDTGHTEQLPRHLRVTLEERMQTASIHHSDERNGR